MRPDNSCITEAKSINSRNQSEATERFVQRLAESQNRIYGYIYSLLGDESRAADVVQETNLVLWRKLDQFDTSRAFIPWALGIARLQVMAHLRDRSRDRLLVDAELAEILSDDAESQALQIQDYQAALSGCLSALGESYRRLIDLRYFDSLSISDVAAKVDRPAGSVKVSLLKARRILADCVESKLAVATVQGGDYSRE